MLWASVRRVTQNLDPRIALSALVLGGYMLAARGVENLYPVSVFPMYSHASGVPMSRVMARGAGGALSEVTAFARWRCDALPVLETTRCGDASTIPYIDREREQYIRSHPAAPGEAGEPVDVVRRVFSLDGPAPDSECAITHCTAVRR